MAMVPKIVFVFQILKKMIITYLFDLITEVLSTRITTNHHNISLINVKHELFRNSFFPSTVTEWNILDNNISNSESDNAFKT